MYCTEGSTYDLLGLFGAPSDSARGAL